MNRATLWAIAKKDMRTIGANLQVWLPMLILPVVIGVLLPGGLMWGLRAYGVEGDLQEISRILDGLPDSALRRTLDTLAGLEQQVAYFAMNYLIAPLFLLIPLMASSVVSADSFAGEKERGTLESLLLSPAGLMELFVGKVLAAILPAAGLSFLTFVLTSVVTNFLGWPLFGRLFFPNANWLPLMVLVMPMLSLTAVLVNVYISTRVATFQAAYQLGGLVVLPIMGLLFGQISGVLLLDATSVILIGVVLAVVNAILLALFKRGLNRSELFESQVH